MAAAAARAKEVVPREEEKEAAESAIDAVFELRLFSWAKAFFDLFSADVLWLWAWRPRTRRLFFPALEATPLKWNGKEIGREGGARGG